MAQTGSRQAPGGRSTICLGYDGDASLPVAKQSSNAFASGSNQNCGNVLTDRPTTALHAPPGGFSTICLGSDDSSSSGTKKAVSSNAFASGSNQNCGNVITDRPSTALHAPPGGFSSICLGMDEQAAGTRLTTTSSNVFANGSNQNCGNFITDRSSTGLHAPPGGVTTLCLGTDVNDWKASSKDFVSQRAAILGAETVSRKPPGGQATIILGASPAEVASLAQTVPSETNIGETQVDEEVVEPASKKSLDEPVEETIAASSAKIAAVEEPVEAVQPIIVAEASVTSTPREDPPSPQAAGRRPGTSSGVLTKGTRAPPGGNTTVLLGTSGATSDWKASSTAFVAPEATESESFEQRAPPGGRTTIILGAEPHDVIKPAEVTLKHKIEDMAPAGSVEAASKKGLLLLQEPTPLRSQRAPPGGATTVLLG